MAEPLLSVRGLTVAFPHGEAVSDVSFDVPEGKTLAVVGESGSGKTLSARSILRILPKEARITAGEILFGGLDIAALKPGDRRLRTLRGGAIGMIYQEPMAALSPYYTIGNQIEETLIQHGARRRDARARALQVLGEVAMPNPAEQLDAYSFELSGGQRQRAMIAMALSTNPGLLIADEPTTALDVTTQSVILHLLRKLQRERGMSMLFITHDMGVVARMADDVVVMHEGRIVEAGPVRRVLRQPAEPYTRALIAAVPDGGPGAGPRAADAGAPILSVRGLSQRFTTSRGVFRAPRVVEAVKDVSLDLHRGETLAIVGESGSGKTTLGRAIIGLQDPVAGTVDFGWGTAAPPGAPDRARRETWGAVRMVFQDPMTSLNPRMTVHDIIADPLRRAGRSDPSARVFETLELVGLEPAHANRYPHAFSGGQRQRIGIARALAPGPRIVILDEPVSALDVTVQARILALLSDLQRDLGLSYLFISHDLNVVARVAHRVAVMRRGEIVELGRTEQIFSRPAHAYTRKLLSARLSLDPDAADAAAAAE